MTDRFSDPGIETISKACPICKSDVKGNDIYLYFCQHCNILYKKNELLMNTPDQIESKLKERIVEHFKKDKDKLDVERSDHVKEKKLTEKQKVILVKIKDKPKAIYHFASKQRNVVHASNCPYAKNIKLGNRIRFKSLSDATGYKRCKCITEIK